jgi:glutaminyl-tRNA synthetase
MSDPVPNAPAPAPSDFIRDIVAAHVAEKRYPQIVTRFPPEPNGYLHIGHAKSICLNFGLAKENGGRCNLRMDDTNPAKEDVEYVDSIRQDVGWLIGGWADSSLGLKPDGGPFYASDYFSQIYAYAVALIEKGKAYVDDLSAEETEKHRGTTDRPGTDSPYRTRTVAENLDLFSRMRAGEFPDGARTLRAKIDMSSPNIWLRDPVLYRIRHTSHHQTGDAWCIYPLYDFAHGLSDYIEGITHSICTLEFEVHRPLYDWILEQLDLPNPLPKQYEFARLSLGYTVMSKRKLLQLVNEGIVDGWDDPRMPTISAMRRRGVPASALRKFAQLIGVTRFNGITDVALLEHTIREELNTTSERRMAVLRPVKIVLTNLAPEEVIACAAGNHPANEAAGSRPLGLTREVYIESDDFMETPPPKYFRLKPGGEVRLKYACIITFQELVKDASGAVAEIRCTADLTTRSGEANAAKKVKGTIHWVSARDAKPVEVRLYDRMFTVPEPDADGDFKRHLNPASLEVVTAQAEPALAQVKAGQTYQFERMGYFTLDPSATTDRPVFNRTIPLKDTWSK